MVINKICCVISGDMIALRKSIPTADNADACYETVVASHRRFVKIIYTAWHVAHT